LEKRVLFESKKGIDIRRIIDSGQKEIKRNKTYYNSLSALLGRSLVIIICAAALEGGRAWLDCRSDPLEDCDPDRLFARVKIDEWARIGG
jgi:hypothetical protein